MLSERELMMIQIRAIDQASPTMARVAGNAALLQKNVQRTGIRMYAMSQAFTATGRSMMRFGFVTLAALGGSAKVAMDFYHAMALANTQAHLGTKEFRLLSEQALVVSSKYGVANTQIAEALYDIFSTTEQTSKQAIRSVDLLAQASVAGATEMRTATRGVIDIQNAFGLSAGSTNRILDLQFQMLRKSGGTYDELVSAFGNVIGSARQTGQNLRSVAGAIAFLTLRGRTQAQASISVSRALDQIGRHAKDMKQVIGVSVYDAKGDFRDLEDIITDMGHAFQGMTTREQVNAMTEMFGAGSIQANRFFRTAIPQFNALNKSVDSLSKKEIAGQMKRAFDIMRRQDPTFVFHRLIESIKNLGVTIATTLAPQFKALIAWIQQGVDWFNKLDKPTKNLVGRALLLAGAFALVGGKILMLVGGIMRIASFAVRGAMGLGALTAATVGVVAVVALLAGAAYLIYKNWDKVGPYFQKVWKRVKDAAKAVVTWFQQTVVPILKKVVTFIIQVWNDISRWWQKNGPAIISAAKKVIDWFVSFFQKLWEKWGDEIVRIVKAAWDTVKTIIMAAVHIIQGIIEVFAGIINGDWSAVWEGVKKILGAAWDALVSIIKNGLTIAWELVKAGLRTVVEIVLGAGKWLLQAGWKLLNGLADGIVRGMVAVVDFFIRLPGRIVGFFAGAAQWLWNNGDNIIKGLWRGIKAAAIAVWNWFKELPHTITNLLSDAKSWLYKTGQAVMQGFIDGIKSYGDQLGEAVDSVTNDILDIANGRLDIDSPSKAFFRIGAYAMEGLRLGILSERRAVLSTVGAITDDLTGQRPFMQFSADASAVRGISRGGGRTSVREAPTRKTEINVHMTGTTREEGEKIARELDWKLRTGGWS